MLRNVYLYGEMAEKFGKSFRFDIVKPIEAVQALEANFPGKVLNYVKKNNFYFVVGDKEETISEQQLTFMMKGDIHLIPEASGAGNSKGFAQVIIGIAIVGLAIAASGGLAAGASFAASMSATSALGVSYGSIALFGATLALGGISQLLAPDPVVQDFTQREHPEDRGSFIFNGPVNRTEQGGPVPVIYGEVFTGSVVISVGVVAEDIQA